MVIVINRFSHEVDKPKRILLNKTSKNALLQTKSNKKRSIFQFRVQKKLIPSSSIIVSVSLLYSLIRDGYKIKTIKLVLLFVMLRDLVWIKFINMAVDEEGINENFLIVFLRKGQRSALPKMVLLVLKVLSIFHLSDCKITDGVILVHSQFY